MLLVPPGVPMYVAYILVLPRMYHPKRSCFAAMGLGVNLMVVDASDLFLAQLEDVEDPE